MMRHDDGIDPAYFAVSQQYRFDRRLDIAGEQELVASDRNLQHTRCIVALPGPAGRRVQEAKSHRFD